MIIKGFNITTSVDNDETYNPKDTFNADEVENDSGRYWTILQRQMWDCKVCHLKILMAGFATISLHCGWPGPRVSSDSNTSEYIRFDGNCFKFLYLLLCIGRREDFLIWTLNSQSITFSPLSLNLNSLGKSIISFTSRAFFFFTFSSLPFSKRVIFE